MLNYFFLFYLLNYHHFLLKSSTQMHFINLPITEEAIRQALKSPTYHEYETDDYLRIMV